jgi:TPR repeat protein
MSNYHEKYLKNQLGGTNHNNMNHWQQRGGSLSEIILLILAQYGYFKPTFDYEHVYKEMLKCEDYFNVLKNKFNTFVIQQIVNNNKHIQTAKSTLFQGIIVQRLAARCITDINEELYTKAEYLQSIGECAAAVVLLDKAISYGHLPSRALKAHMLLRGRQGVAKDLNTAFELVEEGARLGCHHCQGVMAWCYWVGWGCVEDEARSLELARESSGKGSRYGQYVLGRLYDLGEGDITQDHAQAVALYRLAAAQNLAEAQYWLGYQEGNSVTRDHTKTLRWYQLAAAQGYPPALVGVARRHEVGSAADRWTRHYRAALNKE